MRLARRRSLAGQLDSVNAGRGYMGVPPQSWPTTVLADGEQILENLKTGRYTFLVGNDGNFTRLFT